MGNLNLSIDMFWVRQVSDWEPTRCWLPRQCVVTGKQLFLKKCYRGSTLLNKYAYPGLTINFYIARHTYLLLLLTGKL